ncbi:MAG: ECF transporter S component [Bacteroides sp.]|nr:ECF transporter S component [Bacillota bacterium]MCM1393566.1 ECF transporter S component [[Eubacterium] siraeum]MCM1455015.1 ECF transporter S component [Bacteroides sp.]
MLENVLAKKSFKVKITVKSVISVLLVALAVGLPQIIHVALGQAGGVQWLPMYLPVLLGGCLLGWAWGLGIGVASPIVSFLITLAAGNPMPTAARLPFMIVELAVFAAISGLFSKKISANGWMAFPAVLLAQVAGRSVFILLVLIFQSVTPFTPALIWSQIETGLLGMVLQAVLVPFIVMGLRLLLNRDKNDGSDNGKE